RMVGFWQRIVNGKQDKVSFRLYKILLAMHQGGFFHSKWLLSIKNSLTSNGYDTVWQSQENVPLNISKSVKLKLIEKYKHEWSELVFTTSKCLNYRIFKAELVFEQYFHLLPDDLASAVCHFRCLNHKLPIEVGRFWGVERDDRICELCRLNKLGDEYHYLLECIYFEEQRRMYLPRDLSMRPNTTIFESIMKSKELPALFKLGKFCKEILNTFKVIHSNW
ncbi:MAG: hypothetical protein AB2693_34680, partial [Candidatus Thiodiazotropha sp.]